MERIDARRLARILWPYLALWALLSAIVVGVTAVQIAASRESELTAGKIEAENLARVLQDYTARTIDGFDRSLAILKALHERGAGDALLSLLSASLAHTMSTDVERTYNRFDRDGVLVASSAGERPPGEISIADRPYFIDARDRKGEQVRIGEPDVGRVSGILVIPLAKRLEAGDGAFDGVMVVAVDVGRLVHLFRSVRVGEKSSVGLIDREGRVYVWSENSRVVPASEGAAPAEGQPAVPQNVQTHAVPSSLRLESVAGRDSVVAISAVPGTHLLAFAALHEEQLLAGHRVFARSLIGYATLVVLILTLPIALVSGRALREIRRRRVLEVRYADAHERSRTDALTGIANREAFDGYLRTAHASCAADNVPFVLAFIDLDRFKELNDRYGHGVGDLALRRAADTIVGSVRRADLVARVGGDEFAVLMPGAGAENCVRIFDGLREALKRAVAGEGWAITFSIGVVAFASAPPRARDAVALADRLMYEVKAAGRDGTRFATWRDGQLVDGASRDLVAA